MVGPGAQTDTAVFINDADAYGVTECSHISDVCESVRSWLNSMAMPWAPMGYHKNSAGAPLATHVDPIGTPFGRPCLIMDTLVTPWAPTAPYGDPIVIPRGTHGDTIGDTKGTMGMPTGIPCGPVGCLWASPMISWEPIGPWGHHGDPMETPWGPQWGPIAIPWGPHCDPMGA